MKTYILSLASLGLTAMVILLTGMEPFPPKSAGPPACFAGDPPRLTTCMNSGCHNDYPLNSGGASFLMDLGGAENGYDWGQVYHIEIMLTHPGIQRGGFQSIALQDNNDTLSPGTFQITDLLRTQRIDTNFPHADTGCFIHSKVWIEHTDYGIDDPQLDTLHWGFDWVSPSTDVGAITFYAAGVDANVDLDPTGDYVYSISRTITSLFTSSDPTQAAPTHRWRPNPTAGKIWLTGGASAVEGHVSIFDQKGRLILNAENVSELDLTALPSGLYLVKMDIDERTWFQRIVKQ